MLNAPENNAKRINKDAFVQEFGLLFKKYATNQDICKFLANLVAPSETAEELSIQIQTLQEFTAYVTSSVAFEDRPSFFCFIYTQIKLDLNSGKTFVTEALKQATEALCSAFHFDYKEAVQVLQQPVKSGSSDPIAKDKTPASSDLNPNSTIPVDLSSSHSSNKEKEKLAQDDKVREYKEVYKFITLECDQS